MKNIKLVVLVLFLGGAIGLGGTWARADSVVSKDVLTEGSYCHTKFESIREETLASSRPVLKDSDDFVNFYDFLTRKSIPGGTVSVLVVKRKSLSPC